MQESMQTIWNDMKYEHDVWIYTINLFLIGITNHFLCDCLDPYTKSTPHTLP